MLKNSIMLMQREASGQVNKNVAVAVIEEAVREDMAPKIGAHSSHTQKKCATPHALQKKNRPYVVLLLGSL